MEGGILELVGGGGLERRKKQLSSSSLALHRQTSVQAAMATPNFATGGVPPSTFYLPPFIFQNRCFLGHYYPASRSLTRQPGPGSAVGTLARPIRVCGCTHSIKAASFPSLLIFRVPRSCGVPVWLSTGPTVSSGGSVRREEKICDSPSSVW